MIQDIRFLMEVMVVFFCLPYIFSGLYLMSLSIIALIAERREGDSRAGGVNGVGAGVRVVAKVDSNVGSMADSPSNAHSDSKIPDSLQIATGSKNDHIHFVVMIPAHNEEMVLAQTLESVKELDYPKSRLDIVVIADNCTDKTAQIAKSHGVYVLERTHPILRGKGYALKWGFNAILDHVDPDAIVVLDADSIISANALRVLEMDFQQGHQIIQLLDLLQPGQSTWSLQMTRLGFFLFNYVRPMARRFLGLSITLRGNGMCFSSQVLKEYGWTTFSQAEDLDYSLYLLHRGHRVHFEPNAEVLAQMPKRSSDAVSQRIRWESGRSVFRREYAPHFLKSFFRRGETLRWSKLDTLIELSIPPLMNLAVFVLVASVAIGFLTGWQFLSSTSYSSESLLTLHNEGSTSSEVSKRELLSTFLPYLIPVGPLLLLGHILIGLASRRRDPGMWKALVYTPFYLLWKIRVMITALFQKMRRSGAYGNEWVRTSRQQT